jgi:hypothetical protein
MKPNVLEHVGFLNVFLTDPDITIQFWDEEDRDFGLYGCYSCSEQELMDFVLFRAAGVCGCGRFDSRLERITACVTSGGKRWVLNYRYDRMKFETTLSYDKKEN